MTRLTTVPQKTFSAREACCWWDPWTAGPLSSASGTAAFWKSVKMDDRTETVCMPCDSLWIACLRRGRRTVYAFRMRNGRRVWTADAGPVTAGPLHAGAALFLGAAEKRALALDAATGRVLWEKKPGGSVCGIARRPRTAFFSRLNQGRCSA